MGKRKPSNRKLTPQNDDSELNAPDPGEDDGPASMSESFAGAVGSKIDDEETQTPEEIENGPTPKIKQEKKEGRKMGLKANTTYRFFAKRVAPEKTLIQGHQVLCRGQQQDFEGQYTRDQVELMVKDHFGGGKVSVNVHDVERGLIASKWVFEFPGVPNEEIIIDDLYASDLSRAIPKTLAQKMGIPSDDASPKNEESYEEQELKAMELEIKKAERQSALEVRKEKLAALRHKAAQKEQERKEKMAKEERKRKEEEDQASFVLGGPDPRYPGQPGSYDQDLDRPLTQRELNEQLTRERELNALREELREAKREMKELARAAAAPQSNNTELLMGMMKEINASNSQVLKAVVESSKPASNTSSDLLPMLKLMSDGNKNDKFMEMMISALGVKDERKSNETANMIRFIELGQAMSGGGSASSSDEEWWKSMVRGGGDVLAGLAEKYKPSITKSIPLIPKQPTQPTNVLPQIPGQENAPARLEATPGFRVGGPAKPVIAAQPQLPEPARPPVTGTPVIRTATPAPLQEQQKIEKEQPVDSEADMRETINDVIQDMLDEADAKPVDPIWLETAFGRLPLEMLIKIASSDDLNTLIEEFTPYVDMVNGMRLKARLASDANMATWLTQGYNVLRELAIENTAKYNLQSDVPATAEPLPTPGETEIALPGAGSVVVTPEAAREVPVESIIETTDDVEAVEQEGVAEVPSE